MFPIVGVLVVLGAIAGGYLMEKGNLLVLMQPSELIIIGGAALDHPDRQPSPCVEVHCGGLDAGFQGQPL